MTPVKLYPPTPEMVYFFGTCSIDLCDPEAGLDGLRRSPVLSTPL